MEILDNLEVGKSYILMTDGYEEDVILYIFGFSGLNAFGSSVVIGADKIIEVDESKKYKYEVTISFYKAIQVLGSSFLNPIECLEEDEVMSKFESRYLGFLWWIPRITDVGDRKWNYYITKSGNSTILSKKPLEILTDLTILNWREIFLAIEKKDNNRFIFSGLGYREFKVPGKFETREIETDELKAELFRTMMEIENGRISGR